MRTTTLDIPEALIKEAMEVSGATTKSQAIRRPLENMIELQKRKRLLSYKGKVNLDIDLDVSRDRYLKPLNFIA